MRQIRLTLINMKIHNIVLEFQTKKFAYLIFPLRKKLHQDLMRFKKSKRTIGRVKKEERLGEGKKERPRQ